MPAAECRGVMIALVGRQDQPTDGVRDYCVKLSEALGAHGETLQLVECPWANEGWGKALLDLWRRGRAWRGQWVILQYTALMWSRRGFPLGALAVLSILKLRGCKTAVVFHDLRYYQSDSLIQRLRNAFQWGTMRALTRWADRPIVTVQLENVPWLPRQHSKVTFIPVGANLPVSPNGAQSHKRPPRSEKTVAVFGVTGGKQLHEEAGDVAYVVKQVQNRLGGMRLVVMGRGSSEAEPELRRDLDGSGVQLSVLGLMPEEEVVRTLSQADVQLFVRGYISTRRGSAIAGISCGLPLVGYQGPETGHPLTAAGVQLVGHRDREALAAALCRVLSDETLWEELHRKSVQVHSNYLSWDVIAGSFLKMLRDGRS